MGWTDQEAVPVRGPSTPVTVHPGKLLPLGKWLEERFVADSVCHGNGASEPEEGKLSHQASAITLL